MNLVTLKFSYIIKNILIIIPFLLLASLTQATIPNTIISIQYENLFLTSGLHHNQELIVRAKTIDSWEHFKILKTGTFSY